MKPALLIASSALFSSPFITMPPTAVRAPAPEVRSLAPSRTHATPKLVATDLTRLILLAKADAAGNMRSTEFRFSSNGEKHRVLADPAALRLGLAGLMSSSARSMKADRARMALRLSASEGRMTLELTDSGPGMSVQDIVAMYGDGHSALSSARRRIEQAGGVINISSAEGAGTVYVIELPLAGS